MVSASSLRLGTTDLMSCSCRCSGNFRVEEISMISYPVLHVPLQSCDETVLDPGPGGFSTSDAMKLGVSVRHDQDAGELRGVYRS
jgi:hypothetical protein